MANVEIEQLKTSPPNANTNINPIETSVVNFNTQPNILNNNGEPMLVKMEKFPEKYANTSPLGLLGFAFSTIFLSFHNVNAYEMNTMIIGTAIFYGGIAQFIAGTFEIRKGNTFSGTAFCSYGAFWWSFCTIVCGPHVFGTLPSEPKSTACYLLFWFIFSGFMAFATLKHAHLTLKMIFISLTITFLFLALGDFTETISLTRIGGGCGLFCGILALYTACAEVIDGEQGYTFMPI